MIFEGRVKNKKGNYLKVEGIDLITLNENGKIIELKVMIRPMNALIEVATQMKQKFTNAFNSSKL